MVEQILASVRQRIQKKHARYHKKRKLSWLLKIKEREFRNDPHNNLHLVTEGLKNRPYEHVDDDAVLERVADAYNRAKEGQQKAGPFYQVTNEWLPIYEKSLQDVMISLQNRNIHKLRSIYRDFMRNSCSAGLVGLPLDMTKYFFKRSPSRFLKKRYLYDMLHRLNLWKKLLGTTHTVKDLVAPDIGNPYGMIFEDTFVKGGADYLHYYATAIGRLVRGGTRRVVVELGGGYGGMAYYLLRDNDNLTYVDFDLPENMALTAYYLMQAFPQKRIALYGEENINNDTISRYDAIILPSFEMTKMPDASADLVFNSYSLAEMSAETIHALVSKLACISKRYFFHVNHIQNSVVGADEFNIDAHGFDLMYKIPALWNGGRDLDTDEYEYLYQKVEK